MVGNRLTFILGGARSGKSSHAEALARAQGGHVLYVATAQALDDEMTERITRHRQQRPDDWQTLETPLDVADVMRRWLASQSPDVILLDCVTLLAANVLLSLPEDATQDDANTAILREVDELLALRRESEAAWIIVSNEVGMGVVPPTRLGRLYQDALGYANQRIAREADDVRLMVAGLAWHLKPA